MSAPRWTRALLARVAEPDRVDEVLGDLDEAHRIRIARRGRVLAGVLTSVEALDMALALRSQRGRVVHRMRRTVPPSFRAALRRGMPPISWLDFKLGLRMLARYPAMTVVGGLAMALGIAVGAGGLHLLSALVQPDRPYDEVDRIVAIQNVDTRTTRSHPRALHDLAVWQAELRSVDHLGGTRTEVRNVAPEGGVPVPLRVVATSASVFELAPARPLLGRPILKEDEAPGTPPVVVLSHRVWLSSFASEPAIVGRLVRLDGEAATVVGVMPPGFVLHVPSNDFIYPFGQDVWVPFRLNPLDYPRGEGPAIEVVGRLAPGVRAQEARAEVARLGQVTAAEWPATHRYLAPEILTFANPLGMSRGIGLASVLTLGGLLVSMIMVVLCANVALLVYARAATRESEIAVRSALGASRARIVGQLFAEAAALASVAIVMGLAGAAWGVRWVFHILERVAEAAGAIWPPIDLSLSPTLMLAAAGLALLGAVVAGVLPGVKVTARGGAGGLQRYARRTTSASLGRTWSAILVMQIALTTALVPIGALFGVARWELRDDYFGLPAVEYVTARLELAGNPVAAGTVPGTVTFPTAMLPGTTVSAPAETTFPERYAGTYEALVRRLAAEPGVTGVTVADQMPGFFHSSARMEVEDATAPNPDAPPQRAQIAYVAPNFFEVMGAEIVRGRGFGAIDLEDEARTVIVNESFVRDHLGGANAVGRRLRYPATGGSPAEGSAQGGEPQPWLEIVGVVEDLRMVSDPLTDDHGGVYRPLRRGRTYPIKVAVHVPGGAAEFVHRLREVAAEVAPDLRVWSPMVLERASDGSMLAYDSWFRVILLLGAFAILLANAGIYAVVSYTVARRTREIGVRLALGADRARIVSAILSGMAKRVALGVAIGTLLAAPVVLEAADAIGPGGLVWVVVAVYLVAMVAICMAACIVPTRRALAIQPTEALAADG